MEMGQPINTKKSAVSNIKKYYKVNLEGQLNYFKEPKFKPYGPKFVKLS